MIEWFVGFYIPDLGFIHEHEIKSLVDEGYTINADHYQHHSYVDEATGAHMMRTSEFLHQRSTSPQELTALTSLGE